MEVMHIVDIVGRCIREDGIVKYVVGVALKGSNHAPPRGGIVLEDHLGHKDAVAMPITRLLLGSQSTLDLISNPVMLTNIITVRNDQDIRVHCNSETKILNKVGDLDGYSTVWYETTVIANIISISREVRKFLVHINR